MSSPPGAKLIGGVPGTSTVAALAALSRWARIRQDRFLLALAAPGIAYFLVFHYLPFLGYAIAFQDYLPFMPILGNPWIGLRNFEVMLSEPSIWGAMRNTIVIALVQLVLFFPMPIILALMLSSLASTALRRAIQNIVYLPHFISWVIVVSLFRELLGGAGVISLLSQNLGGPPLSMMSNPGTFPLLLTLQVVWREAGWAAIIYLAALLSIDPSLYEAAAVDGANRWQRLWNITLPGIMGITVVLLILRVGNILSVGFEQILLQRNAVGFEAGEVIDTWVYFRGVVGGEWGVAAAAGLLKGTFAAALVISMNKLVRRMGSAGIYQ